MRKWNYAETIKAVPTPPPPVQVVSIPAPLPVPSVSEKQILECVCCGNKAVMFFEGTTYCRECLKEEMRTGISRRFFNA